MPTLRSHTHLQTTHKPSHKPKLTKEYACPFAQGHYKLNITSLRQKEGQLVTAPTQKAGFLPKSVLWLIKH